MDGFVHAFRFFKTFFLLFVFAFISETCVYTYVSCCFEYLIYFYRLKHGMDGLDIEVE